MRIGAVTIGRPPAKARSSGRKLRAARVPAARRNVKWVEIEDDLVERDPAAAGVSPAALQARAGHAAMSTTQRYIDLAGVRFREEAELAEARMFGTPKSERARNLSSTDE